MDRVHAVRSGLEVRLGPRDAVRQQCALVGGTTPEVDPRVDHERVPGRLAQRRDPLRRLGDRPHLAGGVVGVLDVAAHRPGIGETPEEFRRRKAVAALGVDRDRHVHRLRDPRGRREHLLVRRLVAVRVAERGRDGDRTRCHDGETRRLDQFGGVDVPRVRQHQRLAGNVQRPQDGGAHASRFGSAEWLVTATRFQLLITMIAMPQYGTALR